mmetsp:Transcript_30042/g.96947  ORF Transcript_30042/g.96947 Transcript_30042/m.96947 type:complete len:213 (-) Transcript_30042:19-657(-)
MRGCLATKVVMSSMVKCPVFLGSTARTASSTSSSIWSERKTGSPKYEATALRVARTKRASAYLSLPKSPTSNMSKANLSLPAVVDVIRGTTPTINSFKLTRSSPVRSSMTKSRSKISLSESTRSTPPSPSSNSSRVTTFGFPLRPPRSTSLSRIFLISPFSTDVTDIIAPIASRFAHDRGTSFPILRPPRSSERAGKKGGQARTTPRKADRR